MSENGHELIHSEIAERLGRERPEPAPEFTARLREELAATGSPARPERARLLVVSLATGGAVLLLIAAAGAAGIGPIATG